MKVINLYGSPGAGKSTTASFMFSYLKNKGIEVELIREFAKDIVYEQSTRLFKNQVYLLGEQYKRMKDVEEYGTPVAITDCPLRLGMVYCNNVGYRDELKQLILKLDIEFDNINIFVERDKPYNPRGRMQTSDESDAISKIIKSIAQFDFVIKGNETEQIKLAKKIYKLTKSTK